MNSKFIALDAISGDVVAIGDTLSEVSSKVDILQVVEDFKHMKTPIYSCDLVDGKATNLKEANERR